MCLARASAVVAVAMEADSMYFHWETKTLKEVLPTIHPLDCET